MGKGGMFHMGHALFFGLGAYMTAILNTVYHVPILWTVPVAILVPAIFGILLAGPIVHLRGDYLLVTTIGFNIVFVQTLQNNLFGLTGGPNGIFGLDVPRFFGFRLDSQTRYLLSGVLCAASDASCHAQPRGQQGRPGAALPAGRQLAAESIGINSRVYKIFAFGLGAGLAGLAGAVYAVQYSAVSPDAFNFCSPFCSSASSLWAALRSPGSCSGWRSCSCSPKYSASSPPGAISFSDLP